MSLTIDEIERYKGQINLKKNKYSRTIKVKKEKILIIGAGGIGSPCALFLARSGITNFGIVDFDKVAKK